jgi:hypothetical protein
MLVSVIARILPGVNNPPAWFPFRVPGLEVTRRLDKHGHMIWNRPRQGFTVTLERIGGANDPFTREVLSDSTTGGNGLAPEE